MLKKLKKIDPDIIIYFAVVIFLAYNMAFVDDSFKHFRNVAFIWTYFVVSRRQIRLDIGDALIFTGMLSYYWIWQYSFWDGLILGLKVTSMYQIGKYLIEYSPAKYDEYLYSNGKDDHDYKDSIIYIAYAMIIIAVVLFVRGILNHLWLIDNVRYYEWPDMYGNVMLKTHHEFYLIMISSLLVFGIMSFSRNIKALGLMLIIVPIMANLLALVGNERLVVVASAVTAIIVFALFVVEQRIYKKRSFIAITTVIVLMLGILIVFFVNNTMGIHDWYTQSLWSRDGGILHNVRFQMMNKSISMLSDYPFGHCEVSLYNSKDYPNVIFDYAHNSWLDIGRRGGIIPLIITLGFTGTNIYSALFLWIKARDHYKYVILSAFVGITLYCGFEPAILARESYVFWNTEVLLGGILNGCHLMTTDRYKEIVIHLGDGIKLNPDRRYSQ